MTTRCSKCGCEVGQHSIAYNERCVKCHKWLVLVVSDMNLFVLLASISEKATHEDKISYAYKSGCMGYIDRDWEVHL